jgi:hypothetical protein
VRSVGCGHLHRTTRTVSHQIDSRVLRLVLRFPTAMECRDKSAVREYSVDQFTGTRFAPRRPRRHREVGSGANDKTPARRGRGTPERYRAALRDEDLSSVRLMVVHY